MGFFGFPDIERIKAKGDIKGLIKSLSYDNFRVRLEAAKALGETEDLESVEPLIEAMQDESKEVRKAAAEALGKIGDKSAVESLNNTVINNIYEDVREVAAEALGNIGDEKALISLIPAIMDKERSVRFVAANALEKIGWKPGDDSEKFYFLSAKGNLNELTEFGEIAVDPILQSLRDQNQKVRKEAVVALGKIGSEKTLDSLIQVLNDKNEFVRGEAAKVLGKIGNKRALEPLIQALEDKNEFVRGEAVKALGKMGDKRALESLVKLLMDTNQYVVECTVKALKRMGKIAFKPLIQVMKHGSKNLQKLAALTLGKIGWEPKNDSERIYYLIARGELGEAEQFGKSAIPALIQALKEKDQKVRKSAARYLGKIGSKRAVTPLIEILSDKNEFVRGEAAKALGRIGDKSAVEFLKLILKDENKLVRDETLKALGKLRDKKRVEPIIQVLKGSRKCFICGKIINIDEGYLLQGVIPEWAVNCSNPVDGISKEIGVSCEHLDGEHPLALWYWCCDTCESEIVAKDKDKIFKNGAHQFWKTGKPPNFF